MSKSMDFLLLLIGFGITLLDPSLAFGISVGVYGLFVLLVLFLPSFLFSSLAWSAGLNSFRSGAKKETIYSFGVVTSTLVSFHLLFSFCDQQWRIADDLIQAKVEYFCLNKFSRENCVRQVNICPDCALKIDRYKRDRILSRLKSFRAEYPPEIQAKVRAQEKKLQAEASEVLRQPSSSTR